MTYRSLCFNAAPVAYVFIYRCYIVNLLCHFFLAYIFDKGNKSWKLPQHISFTPNEEMFMFSMLYVICIMT